MTDRKTLAQAVVVVKAFWQAAGREPLAIELVKGNRALEAEAWEREAHRWLRFLGLCQRHGRIFRKEDFIKEHPLPDWWAELAGDFPGADDPILSKEIKWGQKFYQNGPIRQTEIALNKPSLT